MPTWYVYFAPDCLTVTAPNAATALAYARQVHQAALDSGTLETRVYDEAREYWHLRKDKKMNWTELFDERQRKEIEFDRVYAERFAHGTVGHNERMIIAKLAAMLDQYYVSESKPAEQGAR